MTYTLEILAAADRENAETIAWLVENTSLAHVARYGAAITRALDEIVELPFAAARRNSSRTSACAIFETSPTRSSIRFAIEQC